MAHGGKEMARKKNRKQSWGFSSDAYNLDKYLQKFDRYINKQQWLQAQDVVEELEQRFPQKKEVLECWLTWAYETANWQTYQQKATEYTLQFPDDPEGYLTLSSVCLKNTYPLLALEALQTFCTKFPDHPQFAETNQEKEEIEALLPELLKDFQIGGEEPTEIAKLAEQSRFLFESHQYPQAIVILEDLINRTPQFAPAYNNLSLIRCFEGNLSQAIALAQQVLELDPDNFQALGNLVRFQILSGETELAQQYLSQLKTVENKTLDTWSKKAESMAIFGDWDGLVELGKQAESSKDSEDLSALFWHCVAVGYATLGQQQKAHQLWEKALKIEPNFTYARQNLENINLPPSEQDPPWAFDLNEWFSSKIQDDIRQIIDDFDAENENQSSLIAQKIIAHNPELMTLVPILIERGSPSARNFAIYMATLTKKPELIATLKEFALGKEGSDQARLTLAQKLNQEGLIPSGNVKMWIKGKEQEILLMGIEIVDQPTVIHSRQVQELAQEALYCLRAGDGEEAETILTEAIKLEPSAPDLQYNLTNAYVLQEREDEAYDLLQKIHQEHPDYTFAVVSLARYAIKDKKLEKADQMLKPLLHKQRFNFQEFCQLCETHVLLGVKQKNPEAAMSWLNMWQQIADEDDRNLAYWVNRLENNSSWFLKNPAAF